MGPDADYEPRYLAGILLFNRQDFFEAHEVWEDLWQECCGPERKFYQALIQAAVGLLHFSNGNLRGAAKLYRSSRDYMERYPSPYLGLDCAGFWRKMEVCFGGVLEKTGTEPAPTLVGELIPQIELEPPPVCWPDPGDFVEPET